MLHRIRLYDEKDKKDIWKIYNQVQIPPISFDQFQAWEEQLPSTSYFVRYLVENEGQVVAYAEAVKRPESREGYILLSIYVAEDQRRKGLGRMLWERLYQQLQEENPIGLETMIFDHDPLSRDWAERRGFKLLAHQIEFLLDWEGYQPSFLAFDQPLQLDGICYQNLTQITHPQKWDQVYRLYLELGNDMPDTKRLNKLDMNWAKYFFALDRGITEEGIWIAHDGKQWIGMTVLRHRSEKEWWNAFTGVKPQYRGRGIARMLKQIAADYTYHMKIPYLRTHNLANNKGMLAINQKLGYVRQMGRWYMERPLQLNSTE